MIWRKFRDEGLTIETKFQRDCNCHIVSENQQQRRIAQLRVGQSSLVSFLGKPATLSEALK